LRELVVHINDGAACGQSKKTPFLGALLIFLTPVVYNRGFQKLEGYASPISGRGFSSGNANQTYTVPAINLGATGSPALIAMSLVEFTQEEIF
jgi:hypothetical protein